MVDKKGISMVLPYAQSNRLRGNIALGFSRKNPVEDNNRKFQGVEYDSLELQGGMPKKNQRSQHVAYNLFLEEQPICDVLTISLVSTNYATRHTHS